MEKSVTVIGKAAAGSVLRDQVTRRNEADRKDHLKIWRQIYQDVRNQWAEAEYGKTSRRKFEK